MSLPTDAKARKNVPLARGLLDYFPDACAAVAELSRIGNEQHNPGEPMHWAREKSTDHADCIIRHTMERGGRDTDGIRHTTKAAWRALALDQLEAEKERAEQFREPVQDEPEGEQVTRWLVRHPDGYEWETVGSYTRTKLKAALLSTPIRPLP
jgi:hypothetical protein